jgi:hypothetical protein
LNCTQQELKKVTAQVDVALSKASQAADAARFLLGEIDSLGKAMKCKYSLFVVCFFWPAIVDHFSVKRRCVP